MQYELLRRIVDVFADYERKLIRSRTAAALQGKRSRGERVGNIPFGFQVGEDGSTLVLNLSEQATLDLAHELRAQGHTFRGVVAELRRQGCVGRTGQSLGLGQVSRLLK